jgi:rhodanese-related sulfurtransferase
VATRSTKRRSDPDRSAKQNATTGRPGGRAASDARATSGERAIASTPPSRPKWAWIAGGVAVALVVLTVGWAVLSNGSGGRSATGTATGIATGTATGTDQPAVQGTVVQANGGRWTNITPDTLASMLDHKDFTLLNVKTPYIGEIAGTDLYIPYTNLTSRAAQLPTDKGARIVVYCRSGNESAIASQTLLDLGYTNILNLDGGMAAWTASGRAIVQLARS